MFFDPVKVYDSSNSVTSGVTGIDGCGSNEADILVSSAANLTCAQFGVGKQASALPFGASLGCVL
jgi:hypothetical protein